MRECCHLTVEHLGIPEVVPDARHRPTIARQGNCGQWTSFRTKPADELSREMARLRRASAISEADDLAPALERLDDRLPSGGSSRSEDFATFGYYPLVSPEIIRESDDRI